VTPHTQPVRKSPRIPNRSDRDRTAFLDLIAVVIVIVGGIIAILPSP